jgi:ATP-dependent DNA helicase RecG
MNFPFRGPLFEKAVCMENVASQKVLDLIDYPKASRIIREAIEVGLVKPHDPDNRSRKHAKYLPFWA